MAEITTYGVGGFDPDAVDKNVAGIETVDAPPPAPPAAADRIDAFKAAVADAVTLGDWAAAVEAHL